jgi:serine/threonine protein kinase
MSNRPQLEGFEILQQLGEGGAARVYLARQHSLDRHVAIKCLRQDRIDDDALARLSLEATTLARLTYPGIVAVHDVVTRDDGVFMVMEYLPGGSLRDHLDGSISLARALQITVQLARALEYAHDHGLVHRDLKPENILFRDNEMPVITDFGIVFHLDTRQSQRLTQSGTIVGTPTYLSPEQISGERASARSDLYSLGVMLHEMLSGEPPFKGETVNAIVYGHLGQPPPPLPERFSSLQPVLDGLLAKEPAERFDSASAFLESLKEALRSNPELLEQAVNQHSLSVPERLHALGFDTGEDLTTRVMDSARIPRQSRRWLGLVAGVVGVLVIGAVSLYMVFDESEPSSSDVVRIGEVSDEAISPPEPTIAVLPFADMSPDRDQEYFGEGLAEEILNLLAGINELRVTGRTSSFAFRDRDVSIPEIGQQLGVAHILQGSVRRSGDRLRVTSQLIEVATGFHLWSERFDRRPDDIFAIQDEIADSIARALKVTLTAESVGTDNLEAYERFLQARGLIYHRDTEGLQQARRLLDRALVLDPDYAPALAASGELWLLLETRGLHSTDTAMTAARQDLQRALEVNENLAEAHATKGLLAIQTNDLERAEVFLERALSINPSLANANNWKGMLLYRKGRLREAKALSEGFTTVDPLFLSNQSNLAMYQRMMGDYSDARQTAQWMQDNFPASFMSWSQMIGVYSDQGKLAQALEALERLLEMNPWAGRFLAGSLAYRLGEFERASGFRDGERETRALIIASGTEVGLAKAWEDVAESPDDWLAWYRLMDGLAWTGRYRELVDAVGEQWGTLDAFEAEMRRNVKYGDAPASLAIAQRELGRENELGETLTMWGDKLDFMIEHGYGTSRFHHSQARFHALGGERKRALAGIAEAMDNGYRDPLIARDPAFKQLHDDPEFVALAERMVDLINAERAELDLPRLMIDSAG